MANHTIYIFKYIFSIFSYFFIEKQFLTEGILINFGINLASI